MKAVRVVGGVVAGILVALVLLIAVEMFSAIVHPFPEGFQGTTEEMCAHVARYPHWVLAACVPMWGLTAFASTWVAGRIGGRGAAIFIGVLLMAGLICNVSMLPYPMWFKPASVLVCGVAVLAASRLTPKGSYVQQPQSAPSA